MPYGGVRFLAFGACKSIFRNIRAIGNIRLAKMLVRDRGVNTCFSSKVNPLGSTYDLNWYDEAKW
jgi:hypothetical protein